MRAASVNRADLDGLYPRWQVMRLFLGVRRPRTGRLGLDVAGVVDSVGPGVTRFRPGDAVFGDLFAFGGGSFAEYVCAPERAFEPIPTGISFEEAATLPHSAILALQGLRARSGRTIQPGQTVLVDGASGNVGPFAVQIARALGAEVTGTCSTEKVEFVRSLGAHHVIDYTKVDYTRTRERYDRILDTDSHHAIHGCWRALRPGGTYVTLGGPPSALVTAGLLAPLLSRVTGKSLGLMHWWKPFHAPDVETLKDLIAAGKLAPAIDRRFPLDEIVEALRHVDRRHAKGKVVVTV